MNLVHGGLVHRLDQQFINIDVPRTTGDPEQNLRDVGCGQRLSSLIDLPGAGGVVGAQALARAKGLPKIITFDMGGTTAKLTLVR